MPLVLTDATASAPTALPPVLADAGTTALLALMALPPFDDCYLAAQLRSRAEAALSQKQQVAGAPCFSQLQDKEVNQL